MVTHKIVKPLSTQAIPTSCCSLRSDKDSWETPQWLFDQLNSEFHFDVDLCATKDNTKVLHNYGRNYLEDHYIHLGTECYGSIDWLGVKSAFMNPPYSRGSMEKFIGKAWEDSKYCKIVCLVKVDSSTKWWSIFYDADTWQERPGCKIRLLPRRVKFDPPKGWEGDTDGPSFPSAILIFDRRS